MVQSISDDVVISNAPDDIRNASHLFLPGVGAFSAAMAKINSTLPMELIEEEVCGKGKPFLGICVGFQILADKSDEFGETDGLGWLSGTVGKISASGVRLPHIGWNDVDIVRECPLLNSFEDNRDFYFVHSFVFKDIDESQLLATTTYGETFPCVMGKDNILGVQFHPEKSQKPGRRMIENFLAIQQ
ncbi:glutamine amidotransferase [Aestuariispira insulae]|uniref:Glutamine amidotransferase n=2 Tax=Aestuariispira insulae TaxID=1461337 RepID=A0A3D9H473_9PROT|nr:glutamine amidotransferase [Aestuariispira insulae]